jgi:hypothetical protein
VGSPSSFRVLCERGWGFFRSGDGIRLSRLQIVMRISQKTAVRLSISQLSNRHTIRDKKEQCRRCGDDKTSQDFPEREINLGRRVRRDRTSHLVEQPEWGRKSLATSDRSPRRRRPRILTLHHTRGLANGWGLRFGSCQISGRSSISGGVPLAASSDNGRDSIVAERLDGQS